MPENNDVDKSKQSRVEINLTGTVERTFSAMNVVKNRLRNRMGDQWMNDCLVSYIEKDIFTELDNEDIIDKSKK